MALLMAFAFLSGFVTILSPCILPILPIVLSGSIGDPKNKSKPLGIITGFILSFTFFTLALSAIVKLFNLPPDFLRNAAIWIIIILGISLLFASVQAYIELAFSRMAAFVPAVDPSKNSPGFGGGFVLGLSLGLLWSPCVGPILASVIALAISGTVTFEAFLIVFAFALGTALPMFAIMVGGRNLLKKFPYITKNTRKIQSAFGLIMVLTGLAIAFNLDRKFQTYILQNFPKYGVGLTSFENLEIVKKRLGLLRGNNLSNFNYNKIFDQDAAKESDFDNSLPKLAMAPEIIVNGEWFNSEPLTLSQLKGKVVLLDFWTYSCINCQRTIPYLKSWWEKYKDSNFVIVGVHSPEFEFEKVPENVDRAIKDFGILYPVFQDNEFATWHAYSNQYWPAKYLIDKDGYVRYYHFGEGNYEETEKAIQELIKETGMGNMPQDLTTQDYEVQAKTRETYLGFYRLSTLASPEKVENDQLKTYSAPAKIPSDKFALKGQWTVTGEYSQAEVGAELLLNFDAKEVFLVMQPTDKKTARVRVYVDGVMQNFGVDNKDGIVTVDSSDLYKLVKLQSPGRHILRIEFIDGNVQVFAFTFG